MIKYSIIITFIFLITTTSCVSLTRDERLVNQIINQHEKIQKKRNLYAIGVGSSIPDQVHGLIMHYETEQFLNVDQARDLFVRAMEDALYLVNTNHELRQYMSQYPFEPSNIRLMIGFLDSKCSYISPPHVALVLHAKGQIIYQFYNKHTRNFDDSMTYKESYEEARRIVLGR